MVMFGLEPIIFWGWLFFILYMGLMVGFGFIGMSRMQNSDDFATLVQVMALSF